ncbi:hypothetical protein HFC70_20255 [Agrobacterium sp. a22-2]|uniref:hypothetical protein n=1 Tax=Agrobacterium sp. a22-2 TaxID=2283840 RepID=UPI00144659C4|nr:hypothetical protein [Agrobacterium sp. a22-2]NKN38688.1 hypothetical protein [Agrobacterium sp. a22-2]
MSEETKSGSNRTLTKVIRAKLDPLLKDIEAEPVPPRLLELAHELEAALNARKKAE